MGVQAALSAGAVFSLKWHFVWCPKYRRAVLVGAVAERLTCLVAEKAVQVPAIVHVLKVMPDHVHLFVEAHPIWPPARVAERLGGYTSPALRAEIGHLRCRLPALWSRSSYVGTVGHVSEFTVRRYIEAERGR